MVSKWKKMLPTRNKGIPRSCEINMAGMAPEMILEDMKTSEIEVVPGERYIRRRWIYHVK